jgi:hypothetical protein
VAARVERIEIRPREARFALPRRLATDEAYPRVKAFGLDLPPSVFALADEVID